MQVVLVMLYLAACACAAEESPVGYHDRVGIPTAERIRADEEAIVANQNSLSRIVGGQAAKPNAHPYLGGLLISFESRPGSVSVCGSALVSRTRLVTAAHCWTDGRIVATSVEVVLGSHFLFSGGERITSTTAVTHPEWNPAKVENDIAVIYLPSPVQLSDKIQPLALPSNPSETFADQWAVAVGYGKTSDKQEGASPNVNEVKLRVITNEQCAATFSVRPDLLCTDGGGGVGICFGDSGGPLFVNRDRGERTLIGVSSFISSAGCESGRPAGFSRVTAYLDFLHDHL